MARVIVLQIKCNCTRNCTVTVKVNEDVMMNMHDFLYNVVFKINFSFFATQRDIMMYPLLYQSITPSPSP